MNRNSTGKYREKRSDTKMGTIEKLYGKDFNVRSDKKLGNFLKEKKADSLTQFIKNDKHS